MASSESTATRYTIPELNEKTSLANTDLLLVSDTSGNAYKTKYETVKQRVATVAETKAYLGVTS